MREFPFELRLCAHLEDAREGVVARQLGGGVRQPGSRVVDVVHVAPGREFDARVALSPDTVPPAALAADVGVGRWRRVTEALDGPPERARAVADRAVEAGFLERTRRGGQVVVRQAARYPDWVGALTAVENKPDLDRPGALERQLRTDVALGLFDRVVLATASHVTGSHLNRLPDPVGVWQFDPEAGDLSVVREPARLSPAAPGVELRAEHPLRTDVAFVDAAEKARARRRIAERAYGKGWRTHDMPACAAAAATDAGLPYCTHFERVVDPAAECGPDCPGHAPADPPAVDLAARRDRASDWNRDPPGAAREQTGLDAF